MRIETELGAGELGEVSLDHRQRDAGVGQLEDQAACPAEPKIIQGPGEFLPLGGPPRGLPLAKSTKMCQSGPLPFIPSSSAPEL